MEAEIERLNKWAELTSIMIADERKINDNFYNSLIKADTILKKQNEKITSLLTQFEKQDKQIKYLTEENIKINNIISSYQPSIRKKRNYEESETETKPKKIKPNIDYKYLLSKSMHRVSIWKDGMSKYRGIKFFSNMWYVDTIFNTRNKFATLDEAETYYENLMTEHKIEFDYFLRPKDNPVSKNIKNSKKLTSTPKVIQYSFDEDGIIDESYDYK
jgi:hypothetical protein